MAALRAQYEVAVTALGEAASRMLSTGVAEEEVARWIVEQRNELKRSYRGMTPPDIVSTIEAHTLQQYGNVLGPSADQLRAAGRSWAAIIQSASRPGKPPPPMQQASFPDA
jgi:hypothetical protein